MPSLTRPSVRQSKPCSCGHHETAFERVRFIRSYDRHSVDPLVVWILNAFHHPLYWKPQMFTLRGVDAGNAIAALIISNRGHTSLMTPTEGESPYMIEFIPGQQNEGPHRLVMYVPNERLTAFNSVGKDWQLAGSGEIFDLKVGLRKQYNIWIEVRPFVPEQLYVRVQYQAPGKFRTSLIQECIEVPHSDLTYLGAMNMVREYARQLSVENNALIIWE